MIFKVEKANDKKILGDFLKKEKGLSRSIINMLKSSDGLFVNNEIAWTNKILNTGDIVEVKFPQSISENIIAHKDKEIEMVRENLSDGTIRYRVITSGIVQLYTFSEF